MGFADDAPSVCSYGRCPALALPGGSLCVVHAHVGHRSAIGVGIRCYACGRPLRLGARFYVRAEGAFHLRPACLHTAPADYAIRVAS
jgi:hypothetical protein